jgi:hypothetical protein
MNSHQNLQTLFSNVIQAILTKIALDYNLSISEITNKIGVPTITDDLDSSIQSYCNALAIPVKSQSILEKPKKIVKKKVPVLDTISVADTVVAETVVAETIVEKPKRVLKKKAPIVTETIASPIVETNISPVITEKIASPIVGETIVSAISQAILTPDKPKKVLKKKTADITKFLTSDKNEGETATTETAQTAEPVEAVVAAVEKPKKVLKKKATVIATIEKPKEVEPVVAPIVKEIDVSEPEELKLKPKKIMLKKPVLDSKKNVDQQEYGEDVEQAEPYESLEMYEDDSLEPKEFNGVKYYVDTSGYIYDFEHQDLVGKLNQSGDSIILLNDFSPMSE